MYWFVDFEFLLLACPERRWAEQSWHLSYLVSAPWQLIDCTHHICGRAVSVLPGAGIHTDARAGAETQTSGNGVPVPQGRGLVATSGFDTI